jgi:hypothetical protein
MVTTNQGKFVEHRSSMQFSSSIMSEEKVIKCLGYYENFVNKLDFLWLLCIVLSSSFPLQCLVCSAIIIIEAYYCFLRMDFGWYQMMMNVDAWMDGDEGDGTNFLTKSSYLASSILGVILEGNGR